LRNADSNAYRKSFGYAYCDSYGYRHSNRDCYGDSHCYSGGYT
jgi:hypothetical protein